jgi:hypothetical protein
MMPREVVHMRKSMTCGGMMPKVTDVVMAKAHAVRTMNAVEATVEPAVESAAVESAAVGASAVRASAVDASETSCIHWSRHRNQQCREDCKSSTPAHRKPHHSGQGRRM